MPVCPDVRRGQNGLEEVILIQLYKIKEVYGLFKHLKGIVGFHEGQEKVVASADYHFPGATGDSDLPHRKLHRVSVYLYPILRLWCRESESNRHERLKLTGF